MAMGERPVLVEMPKVGKSLDRRTARDMFRRSLPLMRASFANEQICGTLKHVDRMVGEGHIYEALKAIRSLYPLERRALGGNDDNPDAKRPMAMGAR